MKKVKVIFDDGSVADIDEADFAEAEKAGAKRHVPNKAKSLVSFEDGSMAEIDNKDTAEAKKFGAKIIAPEKKNEAAPIQSLGGTSPSQTTDSTATPADTTVSMAGTIKPQTVQPAQPTPEGWTAPDFAAIDKKATLFPKQYEQVLQAKDFATKNPSKAIDAFNSIKDFQRFSDKTVAKFDRDNGVYIDENGQPKTAFKEGDIVTDLPTDRPMNDGITYKSGFAQFINGAWKPAPEPPNPTFTTDANPLADVVVSAFAKKKGGKTLTDLTGEQYSEDDDYNRAVMIANKPDDKIDDTEFIDMMNRVAPNEKDIVYESLWSNRFAEGGKKLPAFLSLLPEVTGEYRKILTDKPNYIATQEGNFTALSEAVTKAYELDKEVWEPMNGDVNNYVDSKEFFDMSERAKKGEDVRAYFEQPNVKLIIDRAEKQRKGYGVVTQIGRMFPKRMANEEALFQKQQEDVTMLDKIANAFKSAYVGLKDGLKEVVQFADEKVSAITGSTDEEIRMKSRMNSTEDGEAAVADYVPENFVNGFMKMVGGVAPAFATGGLGTMGKLTTAAYFGLGSAQATIKEYRQNGLDEKTANIAGGINGALMALATWGLGGHPEIKGFQPSFETTQMFLNPATREAGSKQFAKELLASKFVNFGKGLAGNVKSAAELRIAEQVHVMMNDYVNKTTGSTLNTESGGVEDFVSMVGSFALLHKITTIAKRKTYTEKEKAVLVNEAAMGNMKAVMDGLEQLKRNKDVDKNAIRKMEATLTDFAGVQFPKGITKEQKSLLYLEVEKKKAYEEAAKQSEFGSYYKDKIKEADAAIKEILDNPKGATGKVKKLTEEVDGEIEATANDPFGVKGISFISPEEAAAMRRENITIEAKEYTPETKKSGVSVVLPESNVPRAEIEPIKVQEEVTMAGVPKEEAGSGGEVGNVEIKNEGNADSPTKESVLKRLDINNPFYQKIAQGLEKLGLIKKYDAETKEGDVIGGYVQSDGKGGFASGDMYFKADGSISYIKGDSIVTFDKNGNVTSHNAAEVKAKKQKAEIDGKKESIKLFEKTRDSEEFKYKTVNEYDALGNTKKVKRLKTAQELKESTNKINAEINKTKSELADLEKEDVNQNEKEEPSTVSGDEESGVELYSEPKRYNSEIKVGQKYYDNRYGDYYTIEKLTPVEGGDVDATLKYDKGKTRTESGNFLLYHIDAKQHSLSKEQPIVKNESVGKKWINKTEQEYVSDRVPDILHNDASFVNYEKLGNSKNNLESKKQLEKQATEKAKKEYNDLRNEAIKNKILPDKYKNISELTSDEYVSKNEKDYNEAGYPQNFDTEMAREDHKEIINAAVEKGFYQKEIEDGRMTTNDAKKIIESAGIEVPKDISDLSNQEKPAPNETQQNSETKAEVATADSEAAQKGTESVIEGGNEVSGDELKQQPKTGQPLNTDAFHGTDADIKEFDVNRNEAKDNRLIEGVGWFSNHEAGAKAFGGKTISGQIKFDNPLVVDAKDYVGRESRFKMQDGNYVYEIDYIKQRFVQEAKDKGHDGVVFLNSKDGNMNGTVYAVFKNENIKIANDTPTSPTKPVSQATAKPELQGTKKTVSKSADADRQAGAERAVPVDGVKKKTTAADVKTAESQLSAAEGKLRKAEREVGSTQATQQGMFGGNQKGMFAMGRAEAKAALDPLRKAVKDAKANLEKTKKRFEVDSAEAQQELFNNSKPNYETKDGNYSLKTIEGKPTVINNKTGKPASREVQNRIMDEAAENTDFSKGETADFDKAVAEGKNFDGASDKEIDDWTIENSSNPSEIAEIYLKQEPIQEVYSTKDEAIEAIGITQVKESSFAEFDDANNQTQGMAKTYFARKGEKGYTLDVIAKEISDTTGIEVTPADVADYMKRFPNGRVERKTLNGNRIAEAAKVKFTELTGLPLNEAMAERAIMQEAAKQTKAEQEWIETLTNEHKTAEDDYYKSLTPEKQDKAVGNDTAATPSVEEPGNPKQTGSGGEPKRSADELVRRSIGELVEDPTVGDGIHKTIQDSNTAGSVEPNITIEEIEDLQSRGIDPYWSNRAFREALIKSAKKNGVLLDNTKLLNDKTLIHDKRQHNTSENDLYLNADGRTITKLNDLTYVKGAEHYQNMSAFIDRVNSHNKIFPNTAYKLKGFTINSRGTISVVLEQPYIISKELPTQAEIDTHLSNNGFNKATKKEWSNGHPVWTNGKYELFDARPANVLLGKDGSLFFVDPYSHSVDYLKSNDTVKSGMSETNKSIGGEGKEKQPETVKFEFADGTTPTGKVVGKEDGLFVVQDKRGIKYRIEESQILEKDGAKVRDATPRTPEEIKNIKTESKKLANKIRKAADAIGNAKLGGDGAAMSDLSAIPRKLIQVAMKGVAEIIEGGGTIADGIAHFVEKAKDWLDKEKVFYNERSLKKQAEDYFKSAGLIEADKETTIKQDIKAATQTGKVTGDKVTMSAKDALKKQIKDVGRGWRMGMAKGMKDGKQSEKDKNKAAFIALSDAKQQLNEIVGIAKERGVFEGETGSKVIARLVKEITGINTIKQAEKVAAKLDKILDNIEYEKDLQLANDARTAVVKALKTKSSTLSAATKEIIKDFLKLRPQSVTDVREYVDNAKAILTVAKGLKVKGDAFGATTTNDVFQISNKDIEKYTAHERSVMEARAEADFKETYQDLIDAGVIDPKTMSLKEMQEMVDAINSDVDADIDAAAEKMAANENKMKALRNVVEYNRMGLEDYETTDPNLSKQQLQILKALRGIETADLTAPMLVKMNGVINEIVTNGNFVGSGEMALIHTVQQNIPAIKEVFAKYKIEHLGEPGKLAASLTSMQLLFEYITKNRHAAAELQRLSGIFDIFNGHAKAQDVQIKAVDEYGRMKKKMGRATDNAINRFRRGILADVANNFGGTAEDMQLEFNRRKAWVKTTVDRLKEGTEREQQEAAIIEQAYNELLEGSESYADVLAKSDKVNANNSTLVEFWRKQYADRQAMTIEDAELFNNRVFEPVNNYTSTKLKGLENTESVVRKGEDDLLKETHIGRSINSKASGTKSSKSSAASPARNTVLDLDFDRVQAKRFYETNYDVEAGKHIAMARMFFATKGTNDLFGGIKNKALVKDALVKSIQNQKGVTPQEEAVWKVVKKAVNVLSSKGVRIALGSITQVAKQTFGVFSNAIPNMGKDVDLLMKATAQYHMQRAGANELMNQFSIGIRGRQAQAGTNKEVNIEDGGQAQITNMDEIIGRATDISKKIADGIMYSLKAGDAGIAKSTWLAYYMKSLRLQGIGTEKIDFSAEAKAPNQKAAAYAEQMVSRTQTPNDPSALGNLNKTMTTPGRIVKNVMLPFSTFSNNQLARSIADIQQLKKGTAKDAAASLAGTMLEAIVFNTVKVFLIGSLATKGVNAAATALGFRDEEDEAKDANREHLTIKTPLGDRATNAKTKKVIAQSISDVFFNGMGNTVQNTLNSGANWAYRNMAEEYMQDGTKVANPTLFYVPESGKVNYGSYQPMLDQGAEFLDNASYLDGKTDKITKGEGVKNEVEVVDITPEERKARTLSAAINFFALAGLSDAEITHANTKLKRMIDNKMTEKYGKAKAYVVDAIAKTRDEGLANEIESRRGTIKAAADQYKQGKEFDAATKANIEQYQIENEEIQKEADKPVFTKEQTRFKNSDTEGKLYKWAKMTDAERDEMAQFVKEEEVKGFVHDYIKSKRFQDPMADKATGELPTNATLADFKKIYKNPLLAALKHMEYRAVPKKQKPTATAEPKDDDE